MTLIEALQSHKGGLILLKTEIFWYAGRGWDGITGQVCLLMDAASSPPFVDAATSTAAARAAAEAHADAEAAAATTPATRPHRRGRLSASALLLIDGCPRWVWVSSDDLELLQPGCNPSDGVV